MCIYIYIYVHAYVYVLNHLKLLPPTPEPGLRGRGGAPAERLLLGRLGGLELRLRLGLDLKGRRLGIQVQMHM